MLTPENKAFLAAKERAEKDPEYQAAQNMYLSGGWDENASSKFMVRSTAAYEMYHIQLAYEADLTLRPRSSFELTPIHDAAKCRARRLEAIIFKAEQTAQRMAELLKDGRIGQLGYEAFMRTHVPRLASLTDEQRRILMSASPAAIELARSALQ
jgi:hypothetical protein